MDLVLTPDLEQLIDEQLAQGRLRTPAEVVREALLLLKDSVVKEVPRPQQVRVAGRLEAVHAKSRSFEVVLKAGERIPGKVPASDLPAVQAMLGETVLVSGLGIFQSTGEVDRIDAETVERAEGDVSFWSRPPRPLLGRIDPRDLDRAPKKQLRDFIGKWPGDESDDEVFAALEELS